MGTINITKCFYVFESTTFRSNGRNPEKKHLKTRKNSSEINSPLDTIQFISCFVNRESALYNII